MKLNPVKNGLLMKRVAPVLVVLILVLASFSTTTAQALSINSSDVVDYLQTTFGFQDTAIDYDTESNIYIVDIYLGIDSLEMAQKASVDSDANVKWSIQKSTLLDRVETILEEFSKNSIDDDLMVSVLYAIPRQYALDNDPSIPLLIINNGDVSFDLSAS